MFPANRSFRTACPLLLLAALPVFAQNTGEVLDYTTSWVGNSFGGNNPTPNAIRKHVPLDIDGIYVTPDGKVYTNTGWDEGGRAITTFQNGDIVNSLNNVNQNDGGGDNGGGAAIAVDDKYIYAGEGLPGQGTGIQIKNISDHSNASVSLTGSTTLNRSHEVYGIALWNKKLYVTEGDFNLVDVFDTNTLALVQTFSVQNPARIAVDSTGGIWISHLDTSVLPGRSPFGRFGTPVIDHYDAFGRLISSLQVADEADVTAIWIDSTNRLFVADNGADKNIKIYKDILTDPVLYSTFGTKGGVYEGSDPGVRGPQRFRGIVGVGTDLQGNIYVAQNSFGPNYPDRGSSGQGNVMEAYSPSGVRSWQLQGLEFVTMGGVDPQSDTDFYDGYHHFAMDYSQPPGKEATFVADTVNSDLYPEDIRLTNTNGSTAQVQRIQGRKFLFVSDQAGGYLAIFRFDPALGETAIPCGGIDYGAFQKYYNDWIVQPMNGEFIWRDLNGDGKPELNEFQQPFLTRHVDGQVWWPDSNGDIWQLTYYADKEPRELHFRRYVFQGFDSFGAPKYDYGHVMYYDVPAPLSDVDKIAFFPNETEGGTLFLGGDSNGTGAYTKIARYDHWDLGNRKASWVTSLPWDPDPNNTWSPNSFAVAGEFLFQDFWVPHYIEVYSAKTGAYVGRIQPGDNVGGVPNVGNTDVPESIEAHQRANGEYLITQEEDYQAKILLYRWTPPATLPTYTPPAPPAGLTVTSGELTTLSWDAVPNALVYYLYRAEKKSGPYKVVWTGPANTTSLPTDVTVGKTYYYKLQVQTEIGFSAKSTEIAILATPQATAYPADKANYTSPAFTVGCSLCFDGQRLGDVAQGVTITFSNVAVTKAGTYAVRIYYVNGNNPWSTNPPITSPTIDYAVNGSAPAVSPDLVFTGDWNTPGYVTVNVSLNAGTNTFVLSVPSNAPTGTADIDGILVPPSPE
ncbi:MAG TPA: hypothetical protein VKX25_09245 [Bryobacteraceae bacterium]|nr:hypothetical protein [Bryobacteraceae bacterium]